MSHRRKTCADIQPYCHYNDPDFLILDIDLIFECEYKNGSVLPGDDAPLQAFQIGTQLEAYEKHYWFRFSVDPIEYRCGHELINFYGGILHSRFEVIPYLSARDTDACQLYYDIKVPYDVMRELNEGSYEYIQIRDVLDKALTLLDFRKIGAGDYIPPLQKARKTTEKASFFIGLPKRFQPLTVSCLAANMKFSLHPNTIYGQRFYRA